MKVYLSISGTIFGLFALWNIFELITHWRTLESDRWFTYSTSAIIVVSGVLCIWAWVLIKLHRHGAAKSSVDSNMLH